MTDKLSDFDNSAEIRSYLAAIVDSSDDAIIGKTLKGIITSWNTAAVRLFGYSPEEAIGQHINLIIPEERKNEELIIIGRVKEGQQVDHFETMRRTKDGKEIELSLTVSPIRNEAGDIIGASKIARDITSARASEKLQAYLAAIIDSSDDAIISKDLNGIITSWNISAMRVFGYNADEAVGQSIMLLIPKDKIDEEYGILSKVSSGERIEHFETKRQTKDGRLVDISLTVSPIRDHKGKVIGVSKIARDITQQKKTENALLELSMRKEEFLANVSHELRTPMNAVIGLTNILSMSKSLSDKERMLMSTLKESADSLMGLINNLLDFSRFESGSIEIESQEFNLADLIEKTVNITNIRAREKKLPIRVFYAPDLKKKYIGDAFRLQQILTNLLSNAVKFTENGEIRVTVSGEPGPDDKTILNINVADTGIGIANEKLDIIFEKFIQADASITRRYGGSGLGLSICRTLAKAMGGFISVQSQSGIGTTFTLTLPLQESARGRADNMLPAGEIVKRKNVLVADDYAPNLVVMTAMLDIMGYDYDLAETGIEALQKFQSYTYDVILMDVQMHDMDGFEATRRIRLHEQQIGRTPTPIIAMTAHVMESDRNKCFEAGMNDFMPKPFDPAVLEKQLKSYIK